MSTINIVVCIDAQTIVSSFSPGTYSNPTAIPHEYIYMVTQPQFVTSTNPTTMATADLNISCNVGDNVRWSVATLYEEMAMYALPYQIETFAGTNVMSTPEPLLMQPTEPIMTVPIPAAGPAYTGQVQYDYVMQATILNNSGSAPDQYKFYFEVVEMNGQSNQLTTVGYYCWDPTITVAPPAA